jgi:hypothetical protein
MIAGPGYPIDAARYHNSWCNAEEFMNVYA